MRRHFWRRGTARLRQTVLRSFAETHEGLQKLIFKNRSHPAVAKFLQAAEVEMRSLVPEDFMLRYDFDRLRHLPRYLKALLLSN